MNPMGEGISAGMESGYRAASAVMEHLDNPETVREAYRHGKSEILYVAPVEPCRGNGRHVQGDGIGVCKGLLDTRRQNPYTNMETAHIIMETRREFS